MEEVEAKGGTEETSEPKQTDTDNDTSGLKSALSKERDARKEAEKTAKESAARIETLEKSLAEREASFEEISVKLGTYELREAKDNAITKAIDELGDAYEVDRGKVSKLVEKVSAGDNLEANINEIVDLLKVERSETRKERITAGQPAKTEAEIDFSKANLGRLYKENPEAYAAYVEQARAKNSFYK